MSQKWVRAKQWDDRNLPAAFEPARHWIRKVGAAKFWGSLLLVGAAYAALWTLVIQPHAVPTAAKAGVWLSPWLVPGVVAFYLVWPVKFILRAFSSVTLAVILLALVALFGTLASVTLGLLVQIPTYFLYGASVLLTIAIVAALPAWLTVWGLKFAGVGRAGRFAMGFLGFLALGVFSVWLWSHEAWPRLHYNPRDGSGFLLFAETAEKYKAITLRRLPGFEMSEIEFYGWWPLRVVLLLFIVNMVTATVRRIEFVFPNIGVLTVHTGIVVIALGSVYYQRLKVEGDMLLLSGEPDERGNRAEGPPEGGFYDNTEVVLWVSQGRRPEQRLLRGLPRYNDYNLNALGLMGFEKAAAAWDDGRTLDLTPVSMVARSTLDPAVDADLEFRVVGYASYAELVKRMVPAPMPPDAGKAQPSRQVQLLSALPAGYDPNDKSAPAPQPVEPRVVYAAELMPGVPARRVLPLGDSLTIEYTRGMSDARWNELKTPIPAWAGEGAQHALVVEVPGAPGSSEPAFRRVYGVREGMRVGIGNTGYTFEVKELASEPPFPIVTPGYEKASSSLAVVHVVPPALADGTMPPEYDRWVYSRFPEISQDLLGEAGPNGMPRRRAPEPGIRISYIDASVVQVYFDERVVDGADAENPPVRAIVRIPGRDPAEIPALKTGERVQLDRMAYIGLGSRIANTVEVEFPVPTVEQERDKQAIGTHGKAAVAVQVLQRGADGKPVWSRTTWVPFAKYVGIDPALERSVSLPDGRKVGLVFGRRRRSLPEMALKLEKFEMFPYEHSDIPRDYRSDVAVVNWWEGGAPRSEPRYTSLNEPLLVSVPYRRDERSPWIVNAVSWAVSRVAPDSYKFSQAGWDSDGWTSSKRLVEAGRFERPSARFTILGVGNNPGITIIAAGAVMMSVGIPWAFYVKPMIMKGRKRKLQRELAEKAQGAKAHAGVNGTGAGSAHDLPLSREARIGEGSP